MRSPNCCSCEALPKGKKGLPQRWAVALEHSPFYPEGGGQPSDWGMLQSQGEASQVQFACHLHPLPLWVVKQPAIVLMALTWQVMCLGILFVLSTPHSVDLSAPQLSRQAVCLLPHAVCRAHLPAADTMHRSLLLRPGIMIPFPANFH